MKRPEFRVEVVAFSVLREIEGCRTSADYISLLDALDFGDTSGNSESELRDLCVMSLQELKPEDAAQAVLTHQFGGRLVAGKIRNIANEMLDEKLWEEFADMSLHEEMFNVGSLLYEAFPQSFPQPDAVLVKLQIAALNDAAKHALAKPLPESLLVRLLADGMDEQAILHRLFDKQLAGEKFPQADTIIWIIESEQLGADSAKVEVEVTSSGYWLDALRDTTSYESTAMADA